MICKSCGKEIHDGNKFCPFCGEKVLNEEYTGNNAIEDELPQVQGISEISKRDNSLKSTDAPNIKPKQKNNSGKSKGVIVGVIVILVVVICAGIFIVNSNRKKIDIDLIEIMYEPEFAGYEGEGFLANVACVDEDKIDLYLSKIEDNHRAAEVKEFLLSVEFKASKTENLKSGEKVELTAFYDERLAKELKLNIINSSATVKVELDPNPSLYLEKAFSLYKEIISEAIEMYPDDNGCFYQLYDIDGNGVPELFIRLGTCEADFKYYVYQVIHDEEQDKYDTSCIGSFPGGDTMVYGTDEKNAFVTVRNHQGYIRVVKVHFSEDSLKEEELFSGDEMDCNVDIVTEEVCIYSLDEDSGLNSIIN